MNDTKISENLSLLADDIISGNTVVFLGAGFSFDANGISWKNLIDNIAEKYPDIAVEHSSEGKILPQDYLNFLNDINILEKDDGRNFIINTIREKVKKIKFDSLNSEVQSYYRSFIKFNWNAIFSTNYDQLVRQIAEIVGKNPFLIFKEEEFELNKKNLLIFKLMGDINEKDQFNSPNRLVITEDDINSNFINRARLFDLFSNKLAHDPILFLGYSFNDRIAFSLLNYLRLRKSTLGKIYISSKNLYDLFYHRTTLSYEENRLKSMLSEFNPIILPFHLRELSFKLDKYGKSIYSRESLYPKEYEYLVRRENKIVSLRIDADDFKQLRQNTEFLTKELDTSKEISIDDFHQGLVHEWYAYRENFDFQRKKLLHEIKIIIKRLVFSPKPEDTLAIICITGFPGSGKTVLMNRLIYDSYLAYLTPILYMRKAEIRLDPYQVETLIDQLNAAYDAEVEGKKRSRIKPIIVFDDVQSHLRNFLELVQEFSLRSKGAIILCTIRDFEFIGLKERFEALDTKFILFPIKYTLSLDDLKNFQKYIFPYNPDYKIPDRFIEIPSSARFERKFENSLFVLIHQAVDPSQRNIEEIIKSQYAEFRNDKATFKVLKLLATFGQFGRKTPLSFIKYLFLEDKVLLNTSLDKIRKSNLIFTYSDPFTLEQYFELPHRILAEILIYSLRIDPEDQCVILEEVINNCSKFNLPEINSVQHLIIQHISKADKYYYLKGNQYSKSNILKLYETATNRYPTRVLYHQWGNYLRTNMKNFLNAKEKMEKALRIKDWRYGSTRTDPKRNIYNSLGTLYSDMAFYCQKDEYKDILTEEKEHYLDKAIEMFEEAEYSGNCSPKFYHAKANLFYRLVDETDDFAVQLIYLERSLSILERGIINWGGRITSGKKIESDHFLIELHTNVLIRIEEITRKEDILDQIREIYRISRNLSGYFIYIESKFQKMDLEEIDSIFNEIQPFLENDENIQRFLEYKIDYQRYLNNDWQGDNTFSLLEQYCDNITINSRFDLVGMYITGLWLRGYFKSAKSVVETSEKLTRHLGIRKMPVFSPKATKESPYYPGRITSLGERKGFLKFDGSQYPADISIEFRRYGQMIRPSINQRVEFRVLIKTSMIEAVNIRSRG